MHILVTGFEPFGGSAVNPSEQAARALEGLEIGGARVVTAILPVEREHGPQALITALRWHRPRAVLCLGESTGRTALSIERLAINLLDFRIPDNGGSQVVDQPVAPDGPDGLFVTLPVRAILQSVQAAGVPAELSLSAGTFLCNQVLYTLLHCLYREGRGVPAGFIHLPALPQQVVEQRQPSMSMDTVLKGLYAALETIAGCIPAGSDPWD
jgi:pyroglutamyl-peptidase